ncbi:MAG: glycosyltransferase family 4 protein [Planctomycetes bacterium]|nr:glycosyltransferase family 4 protein [Planctomycetota bacterium]
MPDRAAAGDPAGHSPLALSAPSLVLFSGDRRTARGEPGSFADLLERLAPWWGSIDVFCPYREGASPRVLHGRVRLHPVRAGRFAAPFAYLAAARETVGGARPDLVVSHLYGLCAGALAGDRLARERRSPHILEIHGVPGLPVARGVRQRVEKGILAAYLRGPGRRAAAVRIVSGSELARFAARCGVPRNRTLLLPAVYLDHEVYRPGAGEAVHDVVWASRFVPGKGLERFLDAVALAARERPSISVAVVGDGPLGEHARRRAEELGIARRVQFLGWIADARELASIYQTSRLFVLASEHEGGPRAPIEAMACGTPVVVTRVGLLPEVVRHGENGLFTTGSPTDLARQMLAVLADEGARRRMGEAAAAATSAFDRDRLVARYADAYLAIARGWTGS